MVLALALTGCGWLGSDPPTEISVTEAADPPAEGGLRIATVPDEAMVQRAPVLESPLPLGEPIVRDCFGRGLSEGSRRTTGSAPPPPQKPSARPSRSRPSPATAPTPIGSAAPGGAEGGATGGRFGLGTSTSAPSTPAVSIPAPEAEPPALQAPAEPSPDDAFGGFDQAAGAKGDGRGARGPAATEEAKAKEESTADSPRRHKPSEKTADRPADMQDRAEQEPERENNTASGETAKPENQRRKVQDWGATVWLSNDDSMSLASAQRVLYALSRGVRLNPSEIRPHELLNYFSFDTVAPSPGQTFGVLGAAEQQGETLTVSLAVRGANPARSPLDLTVVLDRSCSMAAEDRMGYTKRGLTQLHENLQRGDRLDFVLFDSGVCTPLENFVVGRDDPALVSNLIRQLEPTSATDLDAGLREGYRIQTSRDQGDTHGRNRRLLVITDAELNSGNVSEALVSEVGKQLDEHDIHVSGVGVGREFNDHFLDMLTEKGRGAYVYLGSEAVVDRIFGPGFDSLVRTVAHDVQFALDLPDSLAMTKFYGEEASTNKADVDPIHYHAGTTQLFLQDLAIRDGRIVRDDPIVMRIEYRDAITMEPMTQELRTTVGALLEADPHNLRKGKALMAFADWVTAEAMGADPCSAPLSTYRERSQIVADDAEIAFVNGLVGRRCGVPLQTVASAAPRGVELKVKVDSDIPIAEVALDCAGRTHLEPLSGADTVARFRAVTPGSCTVKLEGTTPMSASVEVPSTGGDLRCMVRGGRISCG